MRIALSLISVFMLTSCMLIPLDLSSTPDVAEIETSNVVSTQPSAPTTTSTPTVTTAPLPPIYFPQPGTPAYIPNFARPEKGCNWMGVAGQVFGLDDKPVLNLIVIVKGKLGETEVDVFSMTGLAEGDPYGPAGYEIQLANLPISSIGTLNIQIFDLDAQPLSSPFTFDTFSDCDKNLFIINFTTDEK